MYTDDSTHVNAGPRPLPGTFDLKSGLIECALVAGILVTSGRFDEWRESRSHLPRLDAGIF